MLQRENLKLAQNYYQLVGNAASECGEESQTGRLHCLFGGLVANVCSDLWKVKVATEIVIGLVLHALHPKLLPLQTPFPDGRAWRPATSF